jgi:light-regulated signal transduction histidine kinase (bacteriophytochrome)
MNRRTGIAFSDPNGSAGPAASDALIDPGTPSTEVQRLREELDRSGRETQRLLDGVVHDIRAAERGIRTSAELLREELRETLGDALRGPSEETFRQLLEAVGRMNPILTAVSNYSVSLPAARRSRGRVPTEAALRSALASLDREIRESGAAVSHDPLPAVSGDSDRLQALFRHLIDNALKYRGAPPPRIDIQVNADSGHWIFSVRDNGIGIDQKYWQDLFTPFKRLHGAEIPGVGLGLAICRKIVETHGGRIWIESPAGGGTAFLFTLPVEALTDD